MNFPPPSPLPLDHYGVALASHCLVLVKYTLSGAMVHFVLPYDLNNGVHAHSSNHKLQLFDFGLRKKSLSKSCLSIPLCCHKPLPLVIRILEIDVMKLENELVNGYREGDRVLYVECLMVRVG